MNYQQKSTVTYNVHICRKNNLVYIASLKAASTYYKSVFLSNGWDIIAFDNINWDEDHVFGFISDPVTRYIKAVTEDYFNEEIFLEEEDNYVPDEEFQHLLRKILGRHRTQCFVLTHHSLPLSITLGDYTNKVDWIPLSDESDKLFTKLCEKYKITLDYTSENIDYHHSNGYKISVYEELKLLFGEGNYFLDMIIAKDIDLYNEVKSKFNVNGKTWDEISWLRNQK